MLLSVVRYCVRRGLHRLRIIVLIDSAVVKGGATKGRSSSSTGRFLMAYRERGAGEAFFAAMDDAGFEGTLLLSNSTDAEPQTCGGAVADSSVAWTMENVREEAKKAASEPRHFYSAQRHSVLQFRRRRRDAPVVSGHLLG